jgi:hypothetical protein
MEFREQFTWTEPSSPVSIDLWADEAVERAWIDTIPACPFADEGIADRSNKRSAK